MSRRPAPKKAGTRPSRGAVALRLLHVPPQQIATALGCSRPTVSHYLAGSKRPDAAKRERLRELYQVEPMWWDEPGPAVPPTRAPARPRAPEHHEPAPASEPLESIAPDRPDSADDPDPVTLLEVTTESRRIMRNIRRLNRTVEVDRNMRPEQAAKVIAQLAAASRSLSVTVAESEKARELHLVESDSYRDLMAALARGLRGFPEAAASCAREFRKVERECVERLAAGAPDE